MVRRKVEIKAIENKSKRHTTFTKRRQGLFKKTKDLCTKCDAEAAVITFSKAGNVFAFGHPAVDPVVNRYLSNNEPVHAGEDNNQMVMVAVEEEEVPPLSDAERKISQVIGKGRQDWDLAVGDLGLDQLEQLEAVIDEIKKVVAARATEIVAGGGDVSKSLDDEKDSILPFRQCSNVRR